jgi:hypothetical protein
LAVAATASIVVWFFEAPAGRFAIMSFWILAAVLLSGAMEHAAALSTWAFAAASAIATGVCAYALFRGVGIAPENRSGMLLMLGFGFLWINAMRWAAIHGPRMLVVLCVVLGLFQVGDRVLAHVARRRFDQIGALVWLPVRSLPEPLVQRKYQARETQQGLTVFQAEESQYETPLPSTPYFNPHLEFRRSGSLEHGFRNLVPERQPEYGYSVRVVNPSNFQEVVSPDP